MVGLFAHVPSDDVSVVPSFGVPLIVGGDVFCGTDALRATATPARAAPTASAKIAISPSFDQLLIATTFRVRFVFLITRMP